MLSVTPLLAAILIGGATAAYADDEAPANLPSAPADEVIVSGSRIKLDGFSAPTPTAVVGEEVLKANATSNLADTLNTMPNFVGSATPQTSAVTVTSGQQAVNGLNLGGLGQNRTLILLNGQRTVGSTLTGVVDVSELPQQLIKRVDVVTGGASASYGSDAVTGIVNFVLDTHYTGLKGEISGGETGYGDDRNGLINITAGTGFAHDRGHVEVSGEDNWDAGVLVAHRPWNNNGWGIITNPNYKAGNGQPQYLITDHLGVDTISYGGTISNTKFRGTMFGPGGSISQETFGNLVSDPLMQGGSWANQTVTNVAGAAMAPQIRRQNVFGRASYELTDDTEVYFQSSYAQLHSFSTSVPVFNPSASMSQSVNNPFLPASLASQMQAAGISTFNMGSWLGDLGNGGQLGTQHPDTGRQVARFAFGFTGDFDFFGKNYTWDADTTYGWSTQNVTNPGTIAVPNFNAAAHPTRNAVGQIVCGTATNAMTGCVPFNVFGLGVNSPQAIQYVEGLGQGPWQDARLHQFVTSANIKGSPFDDWAGPVSFATGIEHREEGAHVQADPYESIPGYWSLGIGPAWTGQFQVTEGYIETNVPLLKDLPFAESANIDAAFRETGYSTFGKVSTWKVGGTYSPGFGVTFRATRSHDIREPTLVDLYSAGTSTTNSVNDPFNNNATIIYRQTTTGNPALQPEDANNTIIGGVYQPSFIPRLNLSADYYNVNISHAISSSGLTAQNIINLCYNGNSSACSLFTRVGTGATQQLAFTIAPLNLASEHQNRMEFEASYSLPLGSFKQPWLQGDLNFNANVTHYMEDTQSSGVPGLPPTYLAGVDGTSTGLPKWKYSATMTWQLDPVSVSLTGRGLSSGVYATNYISCTSGCPTSTPFSPTYSTNHIDGAFYLDLAANYNFGLEGSKDQIYFNVRNLLDKDPPLVAQGSSTGYDFFPANAALYDILGRVMRVGVRFSM